MDPDTFRERLEGLAKLLEDQDPNPARGDWLSQARTLDAVTSECGWLLDNHQHIESISDSPATAQRVRNYLVDRCAAGAALLHAGLREEQALAILERSAEICPERTDRRLYTAGTKDLDAFTNVIRASWLFGRGQHAEARRLAARSLAAAPAIAEFATQIKQAPIPIKSAPMSFTLNGFGLKFYGGSDQGSDGSEIRVRFVTALFVPLVPIDAYRMHTLADDQYSVQGKVPLSTLMRVWKYAALALVAVAIGWAMVSSYLDSPERNLRLEIDEVVALESSDPEAALIRYEGLASTYVPLLEDDDGEAQLARVAEGWVRLATAEIPEPITAATVDPIRNIVARYSALPDRIHQAPLADPFVDRLLDWSDALGTQTPAAAAASLDLLSSADRFASSSRRDRVDAGIRSVRIALAKQLAEDWPLEALRQYGRMRHDPEAREAIAQLLARLPRSASLLVEVGDEIRAWQRTGPDDTELAHALGTLVEQAEALAEDPERQALLQSSEESALLAALEQDPLDQVVIVALVNVHRSRGELDEAQALLDALGKPGLMTHDAQYVYASMAFERGDAAGAAALLEQMLSTRLPAFQDTLRAYDSEINGLRDRLIAQAEQGNFPTQYRAGLTSENVETAQAAFGEWFQAEIDKSAVLPGLQAAYMRQSDIVPVAILLGTVQLQRARGAVGDERQRLLDSAEASFLAIRGEAEGMPSYHMSLAQVYHRLGKTAEGDAEFQILIDDPDPAAQLLAAQGYRDLSQVERARQISESIYASAEAPHKQNAALLRSLLAVELDDRQTWLERSDQTDEHVKTRLLDVAGEQLLRDGEFKAADAKFKQVYELYAARAEGEHGSYNNAAVALLRRHACTGDLRHVDASVELMKRSVAMTPDNAIVIGNYAGVLQFRASLELLDAFIPTKGLRIGGAEAVTLLRELQQSSLHDEFVTTARNTPGYQGVLEVWGQFEALAPQGPTGYASQATWYELTDNHEALVKLVARLRIVDGLDTSTDARAYTESLSGERDEQNIEDLTADLRGRAAVREQAKRASAATRAALLQLDGIDLIARARLHGVSEVGLADAQAGVRALEQAQASWPAGLSARTLADALVVVAIYETAMQDAELSAYWTEHERAQGISLTLHGLLERETPGLATLIANPAFARNLELRRTAPDYGLNILDLVIAKLGKDDVLKARALAVLTAPRTQQMFEFTALLAPYEDQSQVRELIAAEAG